MGSAVEGGWQRPRIAVLPLYEAYISHIWRYPPELLSKLLVSPLITPVVVPSIIPYRTPL